jgi:hypothetical protein
MINTNAFFDFTDFRYAALLAQHNVKAFVQEEHHFTERLFMFYARR